MQFLRDDARKNGGNSHNCRCRWRQSKHKQTLPRINQIQDMDMDARKVNTTRGRFRGAISWVVGRGYSHPPLGRPRCQRIRVWMRTAGTAAAAARFSGQIGPIRAEGQEPTKCRSLLPNRARLWQPLPFASALRLCDSDLRKEWACACSSATHSGVRSLGRAVGRPCRLCTPLGERWTNGPQMQWQSSPICLCP